MFSIYYPRTKRSVSAVLRIARATGQHIARALPCTSTRVRRVQQLSMSIAEGDNQRRSQLRSFTVSLLSVVHPTQSTYYEYRTARHATMRLLLLKRVTTNT